MSQTSALNIIIPKLQFLNEISILMYNALPKRQYIFITKSRSRHFLQPAERKMKIMTAGRILCIDRSRKNVSQLLPDTLGSFGNITFHSSHLKDYRPQLDGAGLQRIKAGSSC